MDVNREDSDCDILLIQTGGTIDKDYPKRVGGYAFEIGSPATNRILDRARPAFRFRQVTVCQKDSQEITDADREALWAACCAADITRILITHGTDTMLDTARYLAARGGAQRIVLTGAHLPETFRDSEADFNVGVALGALQANSDAGVYVAMSGRVYRSDAVTRDAVTGMFISK